MGEKGDKRTGAAKTAADEVVSRLASLGDVTGKGMFGGYGIFVEGVMFGLVDSAGTVHLRVGDDTRARFEASGGQPHGKMPYFSVPAKVLNDDSALRDWASAAMATARAAKK
ncbi:MAG: TfoX/Sxy family protein [Chloroflexi bacterium]|nr:TfoX/Sxy family protein [Chloroflexota bacterium]